MARDSKQVVCVGAGGLGNAALWGLVCGWKRDLPLHLCIFDPEIIELSNLNRQVLFSEHSVGKEKSATLAYKLKQLSVYKELHVEPRRVHLTGENIGELLAGADYVIDATDSTETKFLLNDYCIQSGTPFCYAGVLGYSGQLLSVHPGPGRKPACLRCLFGDFKQSDYDRFHTSCMQGGIVGSVVGHIGLLQANEALRFFADEGPEEERGSRFIRFSLGDCTEKLTTVPPADDCPLQCTRSVQKLDLRDQQCPMTFLYTKLALEKLSAKEQLEVVFASEESVENVKKSCLEEGHLIVGSPRREKDSAWYLQLQKGQKDALFKT